MYSSGDSIAVRPRRLAPNWRTMRYFKYLTAIALLAAGAAQAQDENTLTPDSLPQPGVPQGEVTHYTWKSKIFPGTVRDYWVYVPKQYDVAKPACVMVFQDGGGFQDRNSGFRVPVVFDNLIAKHEMPVTVAIMINPGVVPANTPDQMARFNRSYEYDAPTAEYARFLLEEILPEVGKKVYLTEDPNGRAICGISSGGIAAFTAAWERPDAFRRVISFVGSFTNLRGAHLFPSLIRKMEPKPIRVFMQDGANDQDIYSGSWFIGNNDVAAALKYAGYDYKYVVGTGGHDGRQGTAILPEALKWVWRDYPAPVTARYVAHDRGLDVLIPGEDWASAGTGGKDSPFQIVSDVGAKGIGPVSNLRVRCWTEDHLGRHYAIEYKSGALLLLDRKFKARRIDAGVPYATAIQLSADQSLLFVATPGQFIISYHVEPNGSVSARQPYFDLHLPYGEARSGATSMATDTEGRLYVATTVGIQLLDQPGRVNGIIAGPTREPVTAIAWGGSNLDTLYAVAGGKLYARKMKAKGVVSSAPPVKLPLPRL